MTKYAWHCERCGAPMFLTLTPPVSGHPMISTGWTHMDGSPVKAGSSIICPSCGKQQMKPQVQDVRPHADQS